MKYTIEKLDKSMDWQTIREFSGVHEAFDKYQDMAHGHNWQFVPDNSLFGGYYVDAYGNCYRLK
jgi:hypothetical protein